MGCGLCQLCVDFHTFNLESPYWNIYFLRMKVSIEVQDRVIVRYYQGEVRLEDIIESWNKLFRDFNNLQDYKGIVNVFLNANVIHEDENLNVLVEYLSGHLDRLKDLRIAIVMDTPMVCNTIIVGQKMKSLQIKPFSTEKAALEWVRI